MESPSDAKGLEQIIAYLNTLETRIARIEDHLDIDSVESGFKLPPIVPPNISERASKLEDQISQFWLAKVGIIILCIGIAYLLSFPYKNMPSGIISLGGYIFTGILFWLANYWKNTRELISKYIFGSSLVLIYFITLRLHFFGTDPIVKNEWIEVLLLLLVSANHLVIAYRKQSVYLSAVGVTLGFLTALLSSSDFSVFVILSLISLFVVFLKNKFEWKGLFIYGNIFVFLTAVFWFINNPFIGNNFELRDVSAVFPLSLLVYAAIFSYGNFKRGDNKVEESSAIVESLINCIFSYTLFFVVTFVKFKPDLGIFHLLASIVFLTTAILYWIKQESKYSTFLYSILGYSALSVAIVAQFPKPDLFVWLCWQSLIVVSTAIWFRSKIIIVANFGMYLIIFISYLAVAGTIGIVTLSFGFVALITARILNWQRSRLDLKTEMMRIAYLVAAFFVFPYALYHSVPSGFVALSWTIVAILYYVMSVILKNKKYRWMSLLTFLLTVFYILIIGTTNLEPTYRIISFIVVGIVLLVVSIFYGKVKAKFKLE